MTASATVIASALQIWKVLAKFSWFTRRLLRWQYPINKCQERLLVDVDGSQAQFELLSERPSHALTCLGLRITNFLPFDVTIDVYRVTAVVESHGVLDATTHLQLHIPTSATLKTFIPEISLTDQQARWVQGRGRDFTRIAVELHCRCQSTVQNWEEHRPSSFLVSINADPSKG